MLDSIEVVIRDRPPRTEQIEEPRIGQIEEDRSDQDGERPKRSTRGVPPRRYREDTEGGYPAIVGLLAAAIGDSRQTPTTYDEAIRGLNATQWIEAMNTEVEGLDAIGT